MKKHIRTIMTTIGVLIFLLTLSEIIDMSWEETWGEGFVGSLYYWFLWLGGILCMCGVIGKLDKIEKKIDSKTDEKTM
jgi:hypothetical protein